MLGFLEMMSILFQADNYLLFLVNCLSTCKTSEAYIIGWPWRCMYLRRHYISHIRRTMIMLFSYVVITTTYIWTYVAIFILMITATFRPYVVPSNIPVDIYVHIIYFPYCIFYLLSLRWTQ